MNIVKNLIIKTFHKKIEKFCMSINFFFVKHEKMTNQMFLYLYSSHHNKAEEGTLSKTAF